MSVPKLVRRIQVIFDDLQQDWCDKDYIINWLDLRNEDLEARLQSLDLGYEQDVVVLSNVDALTASLSSYQEDGQALESLIIPKLIEWRRVGEGDESWREVPRKDKVIDTLNAAGTSTQEGILSWEWRKRVIIISPSNIAVDLRVRGEFLPSALQSDSDNYIVGMTNALAYMCSATMAISRGGEASAKAAFLTKQAEKAVDDVECMLIKEDQKVPRQIGGRRSQRGRLGLRIPLG